MGGSYIPINCNYYDLLEHYATLGEEVVVVFRSESGGEEQEFARIVDLYTRQGVEYMKLADGTEIRLDQLISVAGKNVPGFC